MWIFEDETIMFLHVHWLRKFTFFSGIFFVEFQLSSHTRTSGRIFGFSLPLCPCKPHCLGDNYETTLHCCYCHYTSAWLFIKWCVVWVVAVERDGWSLKITNSLFRPFTQISRSQRLLPWEERRDLCWGKDSFITQDRNEHFSGG